MSIYTELLRRVIFKSSQNRTEDLTNSIIIKKHIFNHVLGKLSEEDLKSIFLDNELKPITLDGEDLGKWIEASRYILNLTQNEFGAVVEAKQNEISNLEKNSARASFSQDRIQNIVEKTTIALKTAKSRAA